MVNMSEENDDFEELDLPDIEEEEESLLVSKRPSGNRVTIFLRSTIGPGEKREQLTVDRDIVIAELKITVGNIFGLDPEEFHIALGGRTLDSDDLLSNYDVEDGMEALIIPVSLAG